MGEVRERNRQIYHEQLRELRLQLKLSTFDVNGLRGCLLFGYFQLHDCDEQRVRIWYKQRRLHDQHVLALQFNDQQHWHNLLVALPGHR